MASSSFSAKIKFWLSASKLLVFALKRYGAKEVLHFIWNNLTAGRLEAATGRYMAETEGLSIPPNSSAPSGHLPASASVAKIPAGFLLDLSGLTAHIGRWHHVVRDRTSGKVSQSRPKVAFVISVNPGEGSDKRLPITLMTIEQLLTRDSEKGVRALVYAPETATIAGLGKRELDVAVFSSVDDLVCDLKDDEAVVHLFAGDSIYGTALQVLDHADAWAADLCAIDGYWLGPDNLYRLVLHMAADNIHLLNCDYLHSRFVAKGSVVKSAYAGLAIPTSNGVIDVFPYNVLRHIAKSLIESGRERAFLHVPVPIFGIGDLPKNLQDGRRAVMLGGRRDYVFPTAERKDDSGVDDATDRVSVIIPTKSRGNLLWGLVEHLCDNPLVKNVVVIANGVENLATIATLDEAMTKAKVKVIRYDQPFNFSRMCNLGAELCDAPHLLFLNDDIVIVQSDWLEQLLKPFQDSKTAASGMLLLYPNETVQHAGMFLGFNNCAGHLLRHALLPEADYGYLGIAPRQVSAVTGAALLVDRQKFSAINGFDEQFAHYLQDVDLCLRLDACGWRIVYQPGARAVHMESITMLEFLPSDETREQRGMEHQRFLARWGSWIYQDPWFSPAISIHDESLRTLR